MSYRTQIEACAQSYSRFSDIDDDSIAELCHAYCKRGNGKFTEFAEILAANEDDEEKVWLLVAHEDYIAAGQIMRRMLFDYCLERVKEDFYERRDRRGHLLSIARMV